MLIQERTASSTLPKNISSMMIIENVNTMSLDNFGFGFQYFNDSAKREQVPPSSYGLGGAEYGPISNTTNQYFWALGFGLDIQLNINDSPDNRDPWGYLNLAANAQGGVEGIMSCETKIMDVVSLDNLPHSVLSSRP